MSAIRTVGRTKPFLALGAVVLALGATAGPLTATGFAPTLSGPKEVDAAAVRQPAVTDAVIFADDRPDLFARAGAVRDALGFPTGSSRAGRHVKDGFQKSEYDEVAEVDSGGRPMSVAQFDGGGRLVNAVRFDIAPSFSARVTGDQASKAALAALARSGVTPAGKARIEANSATGGWDMHWSRTEAGFPVRGDETSAHVWQDGRIQSVARVEHPLSALPSTRLAESDAKGAVTRQFDAWFSGRDSGYAIQNMDLEWVGPNAAFDPSRFGATPAPYRLAWVANVKPSGSAAEVVRLVTLYVDAEDGTVIGGDVVE